MVALNVYRTKTAGQATDTPDAVLANVAVAGNVTIDRVNRDGGIEDSFGRIMTDMAIAISPCRQA